MQKKIIPILSLVFFMVQALSFLSMSSAAQDLHSPSDREASSPAGSNPLVDEMVLLDRVFQEVVSAVALGGGQRVHRALESLHGTMEKTADGIRSGSVRVPIKANRVKEFMKLDTKFHRDIEALARAADKNNQPKMLSLTKKLLEGCVTCHRTFRQR